MSFNFDGKGKGRERHLLLVALDGSCLRLNLLLLRLLTLLQLAVLAALLAGRKLLLLLLLLLLAGRKLTWKRSDSRRLGSRYSLEERDFVALRKEERSALRERRER
jgi:hypothetical protein